MNKLKKYLLLPLLLSSCSPGYIIRAAYEEGKILINREDIDDVITASETTDELREKLQYVHDARLFATSLGLTPGASFTKYTKLDKDVLSWVVMASKKDAFAMYTWWFPIVGSVPYKGYFEKEDAEALAKELDSQGYETWVRGTDAFSTLGWFNDPILSTTLKRSIPELVETIIHESVHSTVWFTGSVPFNESLAQYIGIHGSKMFFEQRLLQCSDERCKEKYLKFISFADDTIKRSEEFSIQLDNLYKELEQLYSSELSSEEKITQRDGVFQAAMAPFREKFPTLKNFDSLNNAKLMQYRIYYMNYPYFQAEYSKSKSNLISFIESYKKLRDTETKAPW